MESDSAKCVNIHLTRLHLSVNIAILKFFDNGETGLLTSDAHAFHLFGCRIEFWNFLSYSICNHALAETPCICWKDLVSLEISAHKSSLSWSLIYPYLSYGISAWSQASKSLLNKLLILQKHALRFIFFNDTRDTAIPLFFNDTRDTAIPLFEKFKIFPLNLMYCQSIADLMHDFVIENCPDNLCKCFH